jgi:hypothetical protein
VPALFAPWAAQLVELAAASSPLAGPFGALDAGAQAALARDLDHALQAYVDDDGVVLPIQAWLVTARR